MLRVTRQSWGCDCDGESHRNQLPETSPQVRALRAMAEHIGEVTGSVPETCPWRSMSSPLVQAVLDVAMMADKGLGHAAIEGDPPAVLADALPVFFRAQAAAQEHFRKIDEAQRKQEERARAAQRRRR